MNKVVLNEFKRKILIFDVLLYIVFIVVGFMLLNCAECGLNNPFTYTPFLFYIFAFFSILAYFVNRRKNDYEFLLFGFINILTGTFILVYRNFPDCGFILADAVLLYSIANVLNKGYSCSRLLKEKNVNFFPKVSIAILLLFLGVFVVSSLYNKVNAGSYILGYYFITFGLLSLLEPFMEILMDNKELKKYILNVLSYEEEKVEIKEEKVKAPRKTTKKVEPKKKPQLKNRTIKKIKKK